MKASRLAPFLLSLLLATGAQASEAERLKELSASVSELFERAERARTLVRHCSVAEPETANPLRDALASWAHRNDAALADTTIAAIAAAAPGLSGQLDQGRAKLAGIIADQVDRTLGLCAGLPERLASDEFSLKAALRRTIRIAAGLGLEIEEAEPEAPSGSIEILPLARFSAIAEARMDEIGSKQGAADDRDLRAAREAHLLTQLKAVRPLMLYGRVVADDTLREWRGEQQSSFAANCSGFADNAAEAKMAALVGSDTLLTGDAAHIKETDAGGVVILHRCRLMTLAEAGLPVAEDGPVALVARPPQPDEVRAAPGQGIALDRIDRVLYDATFETRMDGFGNGYVHRREDVYVLLRDGTAWRHDWPFPPADLDAGLSQRRDPGKWFTWSESGSAVTLTGMENGRTVDLSSSYKLVPMPSEARLTATYRFTDIGIMGLRRDQTLAFSEDGTVLYSRDGFAAGNTGTSFVIADIGPGVEHRARYRFDGYALIMEGPSGAERHFFARLDGTDANAPEDVIFDGRIFWGASDKTE